MSDHPRRFDQCERPDIFGAKPPYRLPLACRHDVFVFATEPLSKDTTVIGPVEVKSWVSSDVPDTDFTAKLIDLYPPANWMHDPNGLIFWKGRYHHQPVGFARPEPAQFNRFDLRLWRTSGDCLRRGPHRCKDPPASPDIGCGYCDKTARASFPSLPSAPAPRLPGS